MEESLLTILEENGSFICTTKGISMRPMIRSGKDVLKAVAITSDPQRYDIVLYKRADTILVAHRVIRRNDDTFIICGDNCWGLEYIKKDRVIGVVTEFYRNGRWHKVTEFGYRVYVHVWTDLLFIRRPIFYLRDKAKRWLKKVLK